MFSKLRSLAPLPTLLLISLRQRTMSRGDLRLHINLGRFLKSSDDSGNGVHIWKVTGRKLAKCLDLLLEYGSFFLALIDSALVFEPTHVNVLVFIV